MINQEHIAVLKKTLNSASDYLTFYCQMLNAYTLEIIAITRTMVMEDGTTARLTSRLEIDVSILHLRDLHLIVRETVDTLAHGIIMVMLKPIDGAELRSSWLIADDRTAIEVEPYMVPIAYDDIELG